MSEPSSNPFRTPEIAGTEQVRALFDRGMGCVYPKEVKRSELPTVTGQETGIDYHVSPSVAIELDGEPVEFSLASMATGTPDDERDLYLVQGRLGEGGRKVGKFEVIGGRIQYFTDFAGVDSDLNNPEQLNLVEIIIKQTETTQSENIAKAKQAERDRKRRKHQRRRDKISKVRMLASRAVTAVVVGALGYGTYIGMEELSNNTEQFDEQDYELKGQTIYAGDEEVKIISTIDNQPELESAPYFSEFSFVESNDRDKPVEGVDIVDVFSGGKVRSINLDNANIWTDGSPGSAGRAGYIYVFIPMPNSEMGDDYFNSFTVATSGNFTTSASLSIANLSVKEGVDGGSAVYSYKTGDNKGEDTIETLMLSLKVGPNSIPGKDRIIFLKPS